jgi:hypothetical protein
MCDNTEKSKSDIPQLAIAHRRPDRAETLSIGVGIRIHTIIKLEEVNNVRDECVDLALVCTGYESVGICKS